MIYTKVECIIYNIINIHTKSTQELKFHFRMKKTISNYKSQKNYLDFYESYIMF